MLVRDIMTENVAAIGPDMPIADVAALMAQRNVRHFPIVSADAPAHLIGIVSDRDVRVVGSDHPEARLDVGLKDPVHRIMQSPVWTAHPLEPIEEAAKALRLRNIGAMPVMRGDDLVGIVTSNDLLEALVRMTGVHEGVTRLEVELANRPGAIAGLLDRIASRNYSVASVLTTKVEPDATTFVLRVGALDSLGLARFLRDEGYTVLWPAENPSVTTGGAGGSTS